MPVCGNSFRLCQSDYMFWRKGQAKAMECNSFEDHLWNSLLRASLNSISIKTKAGCCREIRCLLCLFTMLWTMGLQKKKKKVQEHTVYISKPGIEPADTWSFLYVLKDFFPPLLLSPPPFALSLPPVSCSHASIYFFAEFSVRDQFVVLETPSTIGSTVGNN